MKETPITFTEQMARAILEGKKTQTRRIVKAQSIFDGMDEEFKRLQSQHACHYGKSDDRLWVRETWADTNGENGPMISYKAGGDRVLIDDSSLFDYSRYPECGFTISCEDLRRGTYGRSWKSPVIMPRWASRITLEITDIRVERLHDITEDDALAEGAGPVLMSPYGGLTPYREGFRRIWEALSGAAGWDANPWVWVITFKRCDD